jgi:NitT/TauT family transport system ATP-binding protein
MLTFTDVAWGAKDRTMVAGISLGVGKGELAVLLGPSGTGKTTLLRLAAGLIAPQSGTVDNRSARTVMVFQEPRLMPWATALDNVALALESDKVLDRAERRGLAGRWLRRLGFAEDDLAKHPAELSGGMQARVAIARAFVVAPDLVLMDEPFAALDFGLRRDLQLLVRDLVAETGAGVLFVTHDLTETVSLADRILVIAGRPGRIVATLAHRPVADLAAIWTAAAELSRRAELAPVLAGLSHTEEEVS